MSALGGDGIPSTRSVPIDDAPTTVSAPRGGSGGKGVTTQQRLRAQREAAVTAWLAAEPGISTRELSRRLDVSESTASELRHVVEARLDAVTRWPLPSTPGEQARDGVFAMSASPAVFPAAQAVAARS